MKCSACEKNECDGKYENRDKCVGDKEGIKCTCICRITKNEAVLSSALSIGTGVAVAAAGIGLTVATGGIGAIIAGAAIAGSGTSLVFSPIQKYISKEHVTLKESAKEAAIGATIGGITGPIGAIGSIASKGASVAVQFGARILAGSSAGAVTGVLSEGARAVQGQEVTLKSFTQSAAIGAAAGSIGGASSQIATGMTKPIANEVGKAATRIAVTGSSAAITDAGVQLIQSGTVNPQKLILNTTGKMVMASTAEVSTSVTKQIDFKRVDSQTKKPVVSSNGNKVASKDIKVAQAFKSYSDSSHVKPSIRQKRDIQLGQIQITRPTSEIYDKKEIGSVNSAGSAQIMSSFSSQLNLFNSGSTSNNKEVEQENEEIELMEMSSKDFGDGYCYGEEVTSSSHKILEPESFSNDNLVLSSCTASSNESEPLLSDIVDYDLLLDAQDFNCYSSKDQLDVLKFEKEPTNNKTLQRNTSEIKEDPQPLKSKLLHVVKNKSTCIEQISPNLMTQMPYSKNDDSQTYDDCELLVKSVNILECASEHDDNKLFNHNTTDIDHIDSLDRDLNSLEESTKNNSQIAKLSEIGSAELQNKPNQESLITVQNNNKSSKSITEIGSSTLSRTVLNQQEIVLNLVIIIVFIGLLTGIAFYYIF